MNSEEEGGEVSKGGIFSKIHYRDWGWGVRDLWQDPLQRLGGESGIFSKIHYRDWGGGVRDLWQDPLRGERCLSFTIGSGILLKDRCLFVFLEI